MYQTKYIQHAFCEPKVRKLMSRLLVLKQAIKQFVTQTSRLFKKESDSGHV